MAERFFDTQDMARRGRMGGLTTASRHDSRELTRPARETYRRSFETLVDPDGTLTLEERQRRAEALRRCHFVRLARLSVRARARRRNKAAQAA